MAGSSGDAAMSNQNEIVQRFAAMREELNTLWSKMNELSSEASEHRQVIAALEPMDAQRRCFRLVGDVLVERTVAEVLPAVRQTEERIRKTLETFGKEVEAKKENLAAFQTKYKIRVKGEDGETEDKPRNNESPEGAGSSTQTAGVLVSSSS